MIIKDNFKNLSAQRLAELAIKMVLLKNADISIKDISSRSINLDTAFLMLDEFKKDFSYPLIRIDEDCEKGLWRIGIVNELNDVINEVTSASLARAIYEFVLMHYQVRNEGIHATKKRPIQKSSEF